MSDKKDKPDDPDATVSMPRKKPVDDDATVAMTRDALKKDEDATVAMSRDELKKPDDDDVTVTNMTRDALMAEEPKPKKSTADEDATVTMTPGGFRPPSEADLVASAAPHAAVAAAAAASIPPKQDLAAEPSRMPMIAGAIVVFLVLLYFLFGGGSKDAAKDPVKKSDTPIASSSAPATTPAPSTATPPAASSSAPAATTAPSTPAPSAPPATSSSAKAPAASTAAPAAPTASDVSSKVNHVLAGEIKSGSVKVAEEGGNFTISMPMSHQFASGGTDPEPKLRALLSGIGAALEKIPGTIVVTGHADSTASTNAKFPSNQALSEARGAAAAKILGAKLRDPKRVSSDGASDSKPLASGDSADARAKNRRVVIVLRPS